MNANQSALCSLLWPPGFQPSSSGGRPAPSEADLGLSSIIQALDLDGRHSRFIASTLLALPTDPRLITYRQDVLEDLLRLPALAEDCQAILPQLAELSRLGRGPGWGEANPLFQIATRLAELQVYVAAIEGLGQALERAGNGLKAEGWQLLRGFILTTRQDADYIRLVAELPKLQTQFEKAGSITLGLNLDAQLRPESVTIVSVNPGRFTGKGSFLERLLGDKSTGDAVRSISGVFKTDENRPHTPEHELFKDMNRLLERIAAPVAEALAHYTRVNSAPLSALEPELVFYLGAVRLAGNLRAAGLELCRPEIAPAAERAGTIFGNYSLDLAIRLRAKPGAGNLSATVIPNDVGFGPGATIFILTGPNSGGKTTYTRAVGQAQVLAQAGLPVPGRQARISPVDAIFTHFTTAERPEDEMGRLAEELGRLSQIFRKASRTSLVLLNEPLTSTDHASARALSRELLAGLRLLGARTIYVTHVLELTEEADTSEDPAPEAGVVNLVAGITLDTQTANDPHAVPTYTIKPGRPQSLGYASELARRYGLSLAQIRQALSDRGIETGEL